MNLTNPGNNTMDGVYVGPYYASINGGVSTAVICDDFGDESYIPETWTADVFTPPNYTTTRDAQKWAGLTVAQQKGFTVAEDYNMVGWLASEMLGNLSNPTTVGELHFALWAVFDPAAIPFLDSASQNWLSQAASYKDNSSYISDFTIYSPDTNYPISVGGTAISASNPPQEFLVHTPEPPALAFLGLDLSGLAGLVFLLRRRACRVQARG